MLELFSIAGKINLDGVDKAEKELDSLDKKGKGLSSKLGSAAKTIGKAGAVVGGAMAGVGAAAFGMATKVTGAFDDISKGAQRVGVSTDFYQEMDFWASQNGMSHEQMEKAVGRFNQRLGLAMDGSDKYASALSRMGINLDDVRDGTLSTEDAFAKSIQSLSKMENGQEQAALATEMFGTRLARDMLPSLQEGALSIEDARKKAQELGLVIGEDTLNAGVVFQDTWDQLKRSMTTAGQQIMGQLIPIFQTMMEWILENMPMIQSIFQTVFDVISTVFGTLVGWIQTTIEWLQTFFVSNQETFSAIWETIQTVLTTVWEYLQEVWTNIRTFWEESGEQILEYAKTYFNAVWETVSTVFDAIWEVIQTIMGLVVPYIQEVLGKIQAFWNENGAQIMGAVQNAFNSIRSIIEFIMPIITNVIKVAWNLIKSLIDGALKSIMGIVKVFMGIFTGDWSKAWEGAKDIVTGIFGGILDFFGNLGSSFFNAGKGLIEQMIKGIKNMASKVIDSVKNIAKKVRDFLPFSPAKTGPLSDLDKLDFEGPITDSIRKGERGIQKGMADLLNMAEPTLNANVGTRGIGQTNQVATSNITMGNVETLLVQLIETVKQTKDVFIDGEKVTDMINSTNAVNAIVGGYMD